jgi:uncharacterized iron-regulated membrane protein
MNGRIIKKLHRWAAFILGVFIVFQITSGSIAQERFLLMQLLNSESNKVSASSNAASPSEIFEKVKSLEPEFNIAHVMVPSPDTPNSAIVLMGGRDPNNLHQSSIVINFDQYKGEIINEQPLMSSGWIGTITVLHRWVLFGKTGVYVVSILALATILMSLSGLYLFFRTRRTAKQLPWINRLHRSLGFIAAFFLITTSSSGILMSVTSWQDKNTNRSVFANLMQSPNNDHQNIEMMEQLIDADQAFVTAQSALPKDFQLSSYSYAGEHSPNYWFAFFNERLFRQDVLVDAKNGNIVGVYPAGKVEKGEGIRNYLLPIHSGYYFGPIGGFLMTLIGFTVIFWLLSGLVIYFQNTSQKQ